VPRDGYEIGVEHPGEYRRLFDSDDTAFGGSGYNQQLQVQASSNSAFGRPQVIELNLPPLGAMFFTGP
jgi:1,4-alpha-glucan branching enzyme